MTLKLLFTATLSIFILNINASTPVQKQESVTVEVSDFHILTIEDDLQVILREGPVPAITVEGDSKAVQSVRFDQNGDQLILKRKGLSGKEKPVVHVTVNALRILEVTGDAHVQSVTPLNGELLWIKLAGNGEVEVQPNTTKVLTASWANGKISILGNYPISATYRSESGKLITSYRKTTASSPEDFTN